MTSHIPVRGWEPERRSPRRISRGRTSAECICSATDAGRSTWPAWTSDGHRGYRGGRARRRTSLLAKELSTGRCCRYPNCTKRSRHDIDPYLNDMHDRTILFIELAPRREKVSSLRVASRWLSAGAVLRGSDRHPNRRLPHRYAMQQSRQCFLRVAPCLSPAIALAVLSVVVVDARAARREPDTPQEAGPLALL